MRFLTHQLLVPFIVLLTLAGCAGITYHAQPPQISLNNIQLVNAHLLEQEYALTLRIQNTNDFPFFIKGLSYQLEINGSEFAHGVSSQSVNILPYQEAYLTVSLISNTLGVIKQLETLSGTNKTDLHFRLTGKVSHGTVNIPASMYSLPFVKEGTLNLNTLLKK